MATKEFTVKNHLGQDTRHTPQRVTYNGQAGNLWERRTFENGAWVFQGRTFYPAGSTRNQIAE